MIATNSEIPSATPATPRRCDPILQELWLAKRELNAEAGYGIAQLIAQTESFDLESALARLRQAEAH